MKFRLAKVDEYGDAGIAIRFRGEIYTANTRDALVVIYRDRKGNISAIDIEFEDYEEEEENKKAPNI